MKTTRIKKKELLTLTSGDDADGRTPRIDSRRYSYRFTGFAVFLQFSAIHWGLMQDLSGGGRGDRQGRGTESHGEKRGS
jgi:hypothetical protein